MEIQFNESVNNTNSTSINNSNLEIDEYFIFENKLKANLTNALVSQLMSHFQKLSDKEKLFFDQKLCKELNPNWVLNINKHLTNRGDLSTSTLQKVFHTIFIDINREIDENDKNEFTKFKNTFIELFNVSYSIYLNGASIDSELGEYVGKYEIKNGFLNIFLKGKGKHLIKSLNKTPNNDKCNTDENKYEVILIILTTNNFLVQSNRLYRILFS
jgi:hypothetical protein